MILKNESTFLNFIKKLYVSTQKTNMYIYIYYIPTVEAAYLEHF